jgi:S-formylglutathione hydrolase FrmB
MRIRSISRPAAVLALTLAGCGSSPVHSGDSAAHGASVQRYRIVSRYVHGSHAQVGVRPAGSAAAPPLLVFLHGRGAGAESNANGAFLAALSALGPRAPAVVFPDGGDHSYWHDRRGGEWAAYVMNEVIPQAVRRLHADRHRVAIGGVSMGGFGAFDLALHHSGRFCAVGGHSPAIWRQAGETAPGAFDDASDFARNDVIGLARRRRPAPAVMIDSGDGDPFVAGDRALASALGVAKRTWPGGHDADYWHAHYGDDLRFYTRALARCHTPLGS